jgi:hypothetical protein
VKTTVIAVLAFELFAVSCSSGDEPGAPVDASETVATLPSTGDPGADLLAAQETWYRIKLDGTRCRTWSSAATCGVESRTSKPT